MSHVPAPESTPEASQPESGPVSDRDAQDAREALEAEVDQLPLTQTLVMEVLAARHRTGETHWTFLTKAIPAMTALAQRGFVTWKSGIVERTILARLTDKGRDAFLMQGYKPAADAELAPLVARVAELEAEVGRSRNAHARAIVQLSECMERAEKAEADLLNAWLAVEDVTDEVDRGGSLADYIAALAAAGPAVSDGEGATSEADPFPCDNCGTPEADCPGLPVETTCCGVLCAHSSVSPVVAPSATGEELSHGETWQTGFATDEGGGDRG